MDFIKSPWCRPESRTPLCIIILYAYIDIVPITHHNVSIVQRVLIIRVSQHRYCETGASVRSLAQIARERRVLPCNTHITSVQRYAPSAPSTPPRTSRDNSLFRRYYYCFRPARIVLCRLIIHVQPPVAVRAAIRVSVDPIVEGAFGTRRRPEKATAYVRAIAHVSTRTHIRDAR